MAKINIAQTLKDQRISGVITLEVKPEEGVAVITNDKDKEFKVKADGDVEKGTFYYEDGIFMTDFDVGLTYKMRVSTFYKVDKASIEAVSPEAPVSGSGAPRAMGTMID